MKEINLSAGKEYLTQRNNKISPMSTCNVTAAIMALEASDIPFGDSMKWAQEEDALADLLLSDESYEIMKRKYPWAIRDGYMPYEVHGMLEWGINEFVGQKVDTFSTNVSIMDILLNIKDNRCAPLVSGKFTKFGHIVAVVGYIENAPFKTLHDIEYIIIDDPYGDYWTDYEIRNGDNVQMTVQQFNRIVKSSDNLGAKWAHILNR